MNEESLLDKVLRKAGLESLPEKFDGNGVWLYAIARLHKIDGSIGYGILKRTADFKYSYRYTNGNIQQIDEKQTEIFPIIMLDTDSVRTFANDNPEDRITYLKRVRPKWLADVKLEDMSIEELNKEVVRYAMVQQMNRIEKKSNL